MEKGKSNLETRQFGSTAMKITPLGFGSWALGGIDGLFAWY